MKHIYLIFYFLSIIGFSQENAKDEFWAQDFEEAKHIAKTENKPILMYFTGSDWCMPCIMLKEDFFGSEKFKKYKNAYIFLKVDIPRNSDLLTENQKIENYKLLEAYNKNKVFPLVNILNNKGKILDNVSGYSSLRDPKYYFELLEQYN